MFGKRSRSAEWFNFDVMMVVVCEYAFLESLKNPVMSCMGKPQQRDVWKLFVSNSCPVVDPQTPGASNLSHIPCNTAAGNAAGRLQNINLEDLQFTGHGHPEWSFMHATSTRLVLAVVAIETSRHVVG